MTGPRPGEVPWRTTPTERPFRDVASDGTGACGGTDALRPPEVGADATAPGSTGDAGRAAARSTPSESSRRDSRPDPRIAPSEASRRDSLPGDALAAPSPLPSLPPLVAGDDQASRDAVERWMDDDRVAHVDEPPLRPYRVLPPTPEPSPVTMHPPARRVPDDDLDARDDPDEEEYEDPQVRAWRQEREFEAQFGPWRAGAGTRPPMRRSTLVSPPVLFLVLVVIVIVFYALTT